MGSAPKPTLSVVGGGLGAGKTTLISRLLRRDDMRGTAVVVNEFGALGIDDLVLAAEASSPRVALLRNGCVCCTPGNDLSQAVLDVLEADGGTPIQRVIIETSGAAELSSVLARVAEDHRLRRSVRLDAAIALVDCTDPEATGPAAAEHIMCADRLVLTKTDIADREDVNRIAATLRWQNPRAPQLDAAGELDPLRLFNAGLIDAVTGEPDPERWLSYTRIHAASNTVISRSFESGVQDWPDLSRRIATMQRAAGQGFLRLKGLVHTADDDRPLVVQAVREQVFRPVRLPAWPGEPRTRIVAIARADAAPALDRFGQGFAPHPVHDH